MNKPRLIAALGRRASNAAGKHGDRRLKRLKSRAAKRSQAVREQTHD